MPDTYDVLFSGKIAPGTDEQKVKNLTMKAFHASPEQLAKLFSGRAVILKSNLSREAAETFLKKLKAIGLVCEARKKGQPEASAPQASSDSWEIAPAGADINPLKGPEPPPAPNTSQFELKPREEYLAEPDSAPEPQAPDTSHLTLE